MATLDEEIKRLQAISALLEAPEAQAQAKADAAAKPTSKDLSHYDDWREWPAIDPSQIPEGHLDLAPPEKKLEIPTPTPESPAGPTNVLTDPESGTPYVVDPTTKEKIPRAELATPSEKEAFTPSDVTLSPETVTRTPRATLIDPDPDRQYMVSEPRLAETPPVPGFVRGSQNAILNPAAGVTPHISPYRDPDPDNPDYKTPLSTEEEKKFQSWVKKNNIPFDDSLSSDYDMRGYWKAQQEGDPNAVRSSKNLHFPDTYKTPFHKTFSNESQYSTSDAPHWEGDRLIDKDGQVVADETPQAKPPMAPLPPIAQPTGPKLVGAHTELAAPGRMDLRPDEPTPPTPPPPVEKPVVTQPITPSPAVQAAVNPDDWRTWIKPDGTQVAPQAAKTPAEPYEGPSAMNAPNGRAPSALIIHHTGGRNSAESVVDDWRTHRPGVGAQMIMDRDGVIHDTAKEFGYGGTGNFLHSVIPGVSNQTAVGIEVIAKDDADMTQAQLDSLKRLAGPNGPYASVPVYGHSQVSPGDRDNEGVRGVAAINEARASGGGAETDTSQVLRQLNSGGLNATHFGYNSDPDLDSYSAAGEGKYIKNMVAGFDVALNAAAVRLVGNPKPGEEFQYAGKLWRYGDKVPEKYSDARFDIFDPNNTALSGGKLGGEFTVKKEEWESWPAFKQEEIKPAQDKIEFGTLDKLNQENENPARFWEILNLPIVGVSDPNRQAYANNYKQAITKYAQDYYHEPDPEKAFQRALQEPDYLTFGQSILKSAVGTVGQVDVGLNQASQNSDFKQLDKFAQVVHPESGGQGRAAFIKTLTDLKDPNIQSQTIGKIWAELDPQKQAAIDINGLVQSAQNLSDPKFQAEQNHSIEAKKALVDRLFLTDPRMKGTLDEAISKFTGQTTANVAITALTPWLRTSAFAGQIYGAEQDRAKAEHPDWSAKQISDQSSISTLLQLAPQEALIALSHGILAPFIKWIERPALRFGVVGAAHTALGAGGGALQQIGANVAAQKPTFEDVPHAAGMGALQALPFGIHGGLETLPRRETVVTPPVAPIEPAAPTTERQSVVRPSDILGPDVPDTSVPWYKEHSLVGKGPVVTRSLERTSFTPAELAEAVRRVRETGGTPEQIRQAVANLKSQPQTVHLQQQPIPAPVPPPLKIFIPSVDWQRVPEWAAVPAGGHYRMNPATGISEARWDKPPGPETVVDRLTGEPQASPVNGPAQESVARRTYENGQARVRNGQSGTPLDDWSRAQHDLHQNPESTPPAQGEGQPWISAIANRFTAERMARGDLGEVIPGEGYSKEELRMVGLKMGPEEIAQHVSDLMHNTGDPKLQAAAVTAQEAHLSQRSHAASRALEADPKNRKLRQAANDALDEWTDFHNYPVAKLKSNWHAQGMTLQGAVPVDLTTFNGLREAFFRRNGELPSKNYEPALEKIAQEISKRASEDDLARKNGSQEIKQQTERQKLPTNAEVREAIMKKLGIGPCRT